MGSIYGYFSFFSHEKSIWKSQVIDEYNNDTGRGKYFNSDAKMGIQALAPWQGVLVVLVFFGLLESLFSYTHLQPAQVIRFSYWLMNHCEALRQGFQRLKQIDSVHWCPLGSGAIAGNALGIDRDALASELGFKNGPSLNAANSTGNRDAVLGQG